MKIFRRIEELRRDLKQQRKEGKTVGFVPTMGYLHEGHLTLIRRSKEENDITVVSIFVNPLQFGPREDFNSYPRDEEADFKKLSAEGVYAVFAPDVSEMYPEPQLTHVEVERLSEPLCGRYRPGHFRGVATVVAKLFNIVQPDRAYFGKKDYQQLKVIEKMARDLNFPVEIIGVDTVREADGLAMSSRNTYLTPEERKIATNLYLALNKGLELYKNGVRSPEEIKKAVTESLSDVSGLNIQYVEILDAETLEEIKTIEKPAVLALAAFVGKARLIDNIVLGEEN